MNDAAPTPPVPAVAPARPGRVVRALAVLAVLGAGVGACKEQGASAAPPPAPPEVGIVTVSAQPIPYTRDLPGRVAPTRIAEVRARVSGLVTRRLFEQGSAVHEGDILYKIDPAPYQVELASAEAALARTEAAHCGLLGRLPDCTSLIAIEPSL